MNKYSVRIEIPEGRVKEILDELTAAQQTIYKCYSELSALGVLTVKEKTADADSADDHSFDC